MKTFWLFQMHDLKSKGAASEFQDNRTVNNL